MPGFSGLSHHSCERSSLPFGCGVGGSLPLLLPFLPVLFFPLLAMVFSSRDARASHWNGLISPRECAHVLRHCKGALAPHVESTSRRCPRQFPQLRHSCADDR